MNERIRELYNQARNEVSIRDGILTPGELRDKFAELLIKNCAGVAEVSMPINSHPDERLVVKNRVLEYFGVEE